MSVTTVLLRSTNQTQKDVSRVELLFFHLPSCSFLRPYFALSTLHLIPLRHTPRRRALARHNRHSSHARSRHAVIRGLTRSRSPPLDLRAREEGERIWWNPNGKRVEQLQLHTQDGNLPQVRGASRAWNASVPEMFQVQRVVPHDGLRSKVRPCQPAKSEA